MLIKIVVATVALASFVQANMAPSYPEPGTVWKTGQTYKIVWKDDKSKPLIEDEWRNFKIDLMTGDNLQQKFLMNIATDLDGKRQKNYRFKAPEVHPPSAVYFLMFTNDKGENAWTTRFAIVPENGQLVEPENLTQPDGAAIPWGIGQLGKDTGHKTESTNNVKIAAAQPEAAEIEAIELEKAADHAEPEVLQAALPGAMPEDMPLPNTKPDSTSDSPSAPQETQQDVIQTNDARSSFTPTFTITLLFFGLLTNLLQA